MWGRRRARRRRRGREEEQEEEGGRGRGGRRMFLQIPGSGEKPWGRCAAAAILLRGAMSFVGPAMLGQLFGGAMFSNASKGKRSNTLKSSGSLSVSQVVGVATIALKKGYWRDRCEKEECLANGSAGQKAKG